MPMFDIIVGRSEVPKEQWTVAEGPFDSPQEANARVKDLNVHAKRLVDIYGKDSIYNRAYMMRKVSEAQDYKAREAARTDFVPFEVQGESFHMAELKDGMVSYYNDLNSAYEDKRISCRLGRYLRSFTDKTDNEIAEICARHGVECNDNKLMFARTRDEIEEVYRRGPNSCMKSSRGNWSDNIHPVECYASPDLAIAYILRYDRITARTVVHMERKQWVCIYGDNERLGAALKAQGFVQSYDALNDARILKLPIYGGDRYAVPYMDCDVYIHDNGDAEYLICSRDKGCSTGEHGSVDADLCLSNDQVDWSPYDDDDYDDGYY